MADPQALGGTVVMMERFDPAVALDLIDSYGVTHSQWVPTMFSRMLKLPDEVRDKADLSSIEVAIHAAAPCPVELKQQMMAWWGTKLWEYYAGTELNGFCLVGPEDWMAHPGTVGRPLIGEIHILDDEGRELPAGESGTIFFGGGPRTSITTTQGRPGTPKTPVGTVGRRSVTSATSMMTAGCT